MVSAVVPASGQVVPDGGAVFDMAGTVQLGMRVSATLDSKKFQSGFKNRIEQVFVDDELKRGVLPDDEEIGSRRSQIGKIRGVELFGAAGKGIRRTEFIDGIDGVESPVHPDVGTRPGSDRLERSLGDGDAV